MSDEFSPDELRASLIDGRFAQREEVLAYKRWLDSRPPSPKGPEAIEKDIECNLKPSPEQWVFGALSEDQFMSLVVEIGIGHSQSNRLVGPDDSKRSLKQVAARFADDPSLDNRIKNVWETIRFTGHIPPFESLPPLQLNGWLNDKLPDQVKVCGSFGISDGIARATAYAALLLQGGRSRHYVPVYAYVRPFC